MRQWGNLMVLRWTFSLIAICSWLSPIRLRSEAKALWLILWLPVFIMLFFLYHFFYFVFCTNFLNRHFVSGTFSGFFLGTFYFLKKRMPGFALCFLKRVFLFTCFPFTTQTYYHAKAQVPTFANICPQMPENANNCQLLPTIARIIPVVIRVFFIFWITNFVFTERT